MNVQQRIQALVRALFIAQTMLCGGCSWVKAWFYIDHMERQERLKVIKVDRVVETLHLDPGVQIADIGAGSGLFTRPLAEKVKPGVVFAVDINAKLLEHVFMTAKEAGLSNIRTVLASEDDPRLPEPVDLVFMCDTLHYVDNPDEYIATLRSYVVDSGRIAIINFFRNWPPSSNQFGRAQLEGWMRQAGFAVEEEHDFIEDRYFLVFTRRAAE